MRKRGTFRARRPAKMVNVHLFARRSIHEAKARRLAREAALKKPGAKVAASEIIGRAMCLRDRKAARRFAAHQAGVAGYHPVAQAAAAAQVARKPRAKKVAA